MWNRTYGDLLVKFARLEAAAATRRYRRDSVHYPGLREREIFAQAEQGMHERSMQRLRDAQFKAFQWMNNHEATNAEMFFEIRNAMNYIARSALHWAEGDTAKAEKFATDALYYMEHAARQLKIDL